MLDKSPLQQQSADSEISVFLMLDPTSLKAVEPLARRCQVLTGTLPFVPHLTMYFGKGNPRRGKKPLVDSIGSAFQPITLKISKVAGNSGFWRAFYLQLENGSQLEKLDHKLKSELEDYGGFDYFPHVSLVYKSDLADAERGECESFVEAALVHSRIHQLTFDRISVFQRAHVTDRWEDAACWQEVASSDLNGEKS